LFIGIIKIYSAGNCFIFISEVVFFSHFTDKQIIFITIQDSAFCGYTVLIEFSSGLNMRKLNIFNFSPAPKNT
jgi:hypothetical protein